MDLKAERSTAVMALKNSFTFQEPMYALMANLGMSVLLLDLRGRVLSCSAKALLLLSTTSDNLAGRDLRDMLGARDTQLFDTYMNRLTDKNVPPLELMLQMTPQQPQQQFCVTPVTDGQGAAFGVLCQSVEQMPLDSGKDDDILRFRVASECADQCIWDHDFENDRHFVSDKWREMRGWHDDGQHVESTEDWMKTIHPHDLPTVKQQVALQNSGATDDVKYEFRQKHSSGHWIWILSRGRIVRRDQNGEPARIIGIDLDITE